MGPNTRTVYLLDVVMRIHLVMILGIELTVGDPSESIYVSMWWESF